MPNIKCLSVGSSKWFPELDELQKELQRKDPSLSDEHADVALTKLLEAQHGTRLRPNAAAIVRDWRRRNENRRFLQKIALPRD
jgi:hypothetical protein